MRTRDITFLTKIQNEVHYIFDTTKNLDYQSFKDNETIKRAICMAFINIGEKINHLSHEILANNKSVPWRAIADFRNAVAHGYDTLKIDSVWNTIIDELPNFSKQIQTIIDNAKNYSS